MANFNIRFIQVTINFFYHKTRRPLFWCCTKTGDKFLGENWTGEKNIRAPVPIIQGRISGRQLFFWQNGRQLTGRHLFFREKLDDMYSKFFAEMKIIDRF